MAWYDTKQAAVDPDNPVANEQIPFTEWNNMVTYLKDKIIDKTVDDAALGNDKILVYKTATSTFVFESQSAIAALDDLPDVTISGVPADNELLAYDTGTSEWINQTAAEAGLATVAGLASYLALAGGTMAGNIDMGDNQITEIDHFHAHDAAGIRVVTDAWTTKINLAYDPYAFQAYATADMNTHAIVNVTDPTSAQDASTKNYDDTHLFTKEAVTSFLDGYIPVYRTGSGKFEMEAAGGSAGLPVVDTTSFAKGSADGTKLMRFEVDGLTTGTTRVMTVPDKDITLCGTDDPLLLSGANTMAANLELGGHNLQGITNLYANSDGAWIELIGGTPSSNGPGIRLYGEDSWVAGSSGDIELITPNAAKTDQKIAMTISGVTDTPIVDLHYGLDMNAKDIDDIGAVIFNNATELTIATGVVTATQSYHSIDTESDAASDDLDTINGGTTGQMLIVRAIDSARTVVCKDGAGNLQLEGDMSLDNAQDTISLIYDGTNWLETGRSNNGA